MTNAALEGMYWWARDRRDDARVPAIHLVNRRRQPYELAIVLSHMRSGSSLLTLLLASHPRILGYGELHLPVRAGRYYPSLIRKLFAERQRVRFQGRFLLDKILHNALIPDAAELPKLPARYVFLVREPRRAIASIRKLDYFAGDWTKAADYYINRITRLAEYAEVINDPDRCQLLTYRDVSTRSRCALDAVSQLLELDPPLREDYAVDATTGRPGVGDFTDRIKAGRILPESTTEAADLGEGFDFAPAEFAFHLTLERLRVTCRTLDTVVVPGAATGRRDSAAGPVILGAETRPTARL